MQLIDALIQGSVLFGIGCIMTMFAGFFVQTVTPVVEQVDGLSEAAGEDLVKQSEAIPPVMEPVGIFGGDKGETEVAFAMVAMIGKDLVQSAEFEFAEPRHCN